MAQPPSRPSSPARRSSGRRFRGAVLGLAAFVGFQLFACRAPGNWRPYERPTDDLRTQVAADAALTNPDGTFRGDGTCVDCHVGCSDPHPTGRKASCVHCHGGDATKADAASAHPGPRFPKQWKDSANPVRPYVLTMQESEAWIRFV